MKCQAQKCTFFSLAIDESTDKTAAAQLTVFVRNINDNFEVTEELLSLESLHSTAKGADLFEKVKSSVNRFNLDWDKLESVCTDGAPAMVGKRSGCVALLEQFLHRRIFKYHCIIHMEALCCRDMGFEDVMSVTEMH